MTNKIYGLLGICAKAGDIVSGMDVMIETVKKGKAKLVIVARRLLGKDNKKCPIYLPEKYDSNI